MFETLEEQVQSWFKDCEKINLSIFKDIIKISDDMSNFIYHFSTKKGDIPIAIFHNYSEKNKKIIPIDANFKGLRTIYKTIFTVLNTIHNMGKEYNLVMENEDIEILKIDKNFLSFLADKQIEHLDDQLQYINQIIPIEPQMSMDEMLKYLELTTNQLKRSIGEPWLHVVEKD